MKQLIEAIQAKAIDYNNSDNAANMARALDKLSSDIFSEAIRFIYELIQNADDASTGSDVQVEIAFSGNYIVVAHNGKAFDEADVKAICSVSDSTKKNDAQKVGYKGIGFKSVFGKGNDGWVCIQSEGEFFRFDKSKDWKKYPIMPWQIIPIYTPINDLPAELYKSNCPTFHGYSVATAIKHRHIDKLKEAVKELLENSDILLFLRHISRIEVKGLGISVGRKIITDNSATRKIEITATKESETKTARYLLKSYEAFVDRQTQNDLNEDSDAPDKLKETDEELKIPESKRPARKAVISFAIALDENDRIIPLKDTLIYTFLPTKISDFDFPFIVNSNFLTNASREQCHDDSLWNQWLFQQVGVHIFKLAADLATIDSYKTSLLNFIPKKSYNSLNLHQYFNKGYTEGLANTAFLPTTNGLIKASEAVYDASEISSLIGTSTLVDFLKEKYNRILSSSLVLPEVEMGRASGAVSLASLGVVVFNPSDLKDFFASKTFIDSHRISENYQLIEFLYKKAQEKGSSESWKEHLPQTQFIFNHKKRLCAPSKIYFPIDNFEVELNQNFDFIHDEVLELINQNRAIKNWLTDIGVAEPTPKNIIEKTISKNLDGLTDNEDKSIEIVRYLFENQKQIDDFSKFGSLQLITTKGNLKRADSCYLSNFYKPELAIETYLPDEDFFVSSEYVNEDENVKEWNLFFTKIGVIDGIKVEDEQVSSSYYSYNHSIGSYYSQDIHPKINKKFSNYIKSENKKATNSRSDTYVYDLYKLKFLEYTNKSLIFSKIYWTELFKYFSETRMSISDFDKSPSPYIGKGYYQGWHHIQSYNFWAFQNLEIFPCTNNKIEVANRIIINHPDFKKIGGNSLPILDLDIELPQEIKNDTTIFNFRKTIKLDEYLKVLKDISKSGKLDAGSIVETKERITLIYHALLEFRESDDKQDMQKWASNGLLLSTKNQFLNPSHLYLIPSTIDSSALEDIAILWLPAELNTTEVHRFFHEAFGINRISESEFELALAGEQTETSLTKKMNEILPYLALFQTGKENISRKDYTANLTKLAKQNEKVNYRYAAEITIRLHGKQIGKRRAYFKESTSFVYYSGSYNNPITLYELPDEICKALHIRQSDEIRTLLLTSQQDAWGWMKDKGYAVEWLPKPQEEEPVVVVNTPPSPTVRLAHIELYTYEWLNEIVAVEEKAKTGDTAKTIRFKDIQWLINDVLRLSQPNQDVLPDDLSEYFTNNEADITFQKGSISHQVRCLLLRSSDFEIDVKPLQANLKETIGESTAQWKARIELPKEDFLIKKLKEGFQRTGIAGKTGKMLEDIQRHFSPANIKFLFGPPGTGKTSRLAVDIIATLQNANYQRKPVKILFIAPTNRAADVLVEKIIQFTQGKSRIENYLSHLPQEQHRFIAGFTYKGLSETLPKAVHRIGATESSLIKEQNLSRTSTQSYEVAPACVVVTTIHRVTFDRFSDRPIAEQSWDFVILDEASMIPLPYGIFVLSAFRNNGTQLPQFVISGDPFQIPPVGATPSLGDLIENEHIKGWSNTNLYTLFELNSFSQNTTLGGFPVEKLMKQYRSVPSIGQLFSHYKYDGLLQSAKNDDTSLQLSDDLKLAAVTVINCDISLAKNEFSLHKIYRYGNYGTYHVYSALMAIELAIKIVSAHPQKNVGIIAPYNSQVKLVQTILEDYSKHVENLPIQAATVHRFQGDERSVIIFINMPSLNKNDELALGQISHFNNSHIINVAISRAVEHLVIIKPFDNQVAANGTIYRWNEMSGFLNKVSQAVSVHYLEWNQFDTYLGSGNDTLSNSSDIDEYRKFVSIDISTFKKSGLSYQLYATNDRLLVLHDLKTKSGQLKKIAKLSIQPNDNQNNQKEIPAFIRKLPISKEAKQLILQKKPVNLFPSEDDQIKKGNFLTAKLSKIDAKTGKISGVVRVKNRIIIIHFQSNNPNNFQLQDWVLCKIVSVNGNYARVTAVERLKDKK